AALTALLGGEIPMMVAPPTAVMANIKAGKLKALATTGPQRWAGLPEVPTVAEQGVAGYDVQSWAGLMAPAGTPRAVVDRLHAEVQKVLAVPAVRSRLEDMGGDVRGSTPEEMRNLVAQQTQRWVQVINDAKIPKQ
ncbi:MAG: tripartite tricarboxylate transporter substrate binding protein, partial [Betaproteobacteria bacterium]|nr:tripartite tricarboxylate transporter substrate binding protein [Betaproteobacteria bacterium]